MMNATNIMGFGSGIGLVTMLLFWVLMGFAIAALWKYLAGSKK